MAFPTTTFVTKTTVIARAWLQAVNDFLAGLELSTGSSLIGHISSGTGAAATTVQAKLRARSDAIDFEAIGDGDDDTAKLQTGLSNAANTNAYGTFKRHTHLNAGYYLHSTTVTVPSGATIEGEGPASTNVNGAGYASATKAPMFSWTSAPDWRIAGLRMEGGNKASGGYFGTSYYGVADQCHFNSMNGYGVKLSESAQSTLNSCSFYYYTATANVGVLLDGGSMTDIHHCQFDTRSIGVSSTFYGASAPYNSISGNPSGARISLSSFGAQWPCFKIPNGDSLWDIQGCYVEGVGGQTDTNVIDIGSANGASNGSGQTNLNFERNQIAAVKVADIYINNGGTVNLHNNEIGVNATVAASTLWLHASGNTFLGGKTLTDQAQFSTVEERNKRTMASTPANAARIDSLDSTFKVWTAALTRSLSGYVQKVVDALTFEWRVSGSATTKMTLGTVGQLSTAGALFPGVPGASPAQQSAAGLWGGTGVPNNTYGANGDFYFRSDGGAGTSIYMKRTGTWAGVV